MNDVVGIVAHVVLGQAAGEFDVKSTLSDAEDRMDKSVENVQGNLETLRTGRAR